MTDLASAFLDLIRRDKRGRLKIYLGYASGVGKTYQMLQEAHRLKEEGIDVVIGAVEFHGRTDLSAAVNGLERLPMLRSEFRGIPVEEMDLDAILLRRPQVVLIDELAHANSPGARNLKRFHDMEDLLAAGINVIATLNVQHLESLLETVERITGTRVRERVPDSVLAEADQVINVDITPEDLRKRLKAGRILAPDAAQAALDSEFQAARLEQLRELALRESASHIDSRRREASDDASRNPSDQVMVCLDPEGRDNAALLRYSSRLAGRLNRNWYAVIVQPLEQGTPPMGAGEKRLHSEILALANQFGAMVFALKGNDVVAALARFAREYRVGHVIVGKPRKRPWWNRFPGPDGVATGLIKAQEGFSVIVIDARKPFPSSGAADSEPIRAETAGKIRIADFLAPGSIRIWEEPVSKLQAMQDLLRQIAKSGHGLDIGLMLGKLLEREAQGSTFLNDGLALPHARIEGLEKPLVAFGISQGGILDAYSQKPIEAVFLLLSPREATRSHLQLLAVAGRMMLDRTLRKRLRNARSAQEAFGIILGTENTGGVGND